MTQVYRNTQVVSVSLPKKVARKLEKTRKSRGQSRSAFIASLIEKEAEEARWKEIFKEGREIGKKLKITSEDDIDRILHEAS
ncbi:MAG: ribbon-helix-helix protein, CopG family [Patescibacteria group bacterium]